MAFAEKVGGGGGLSLFMKLYRLQSPSRYLITVGYSTISERDVEVCESNS